MKVEKTTNKNQENKYMMLKQDILELPHIHKKINTCMDDNLDMICEKLNRIYTLSFYNLWRFDIKENEKNISEKIYLQNEIDKENLDKFCGIKIKDIQYNNFEEAIQKTKDELDNNNPIILHMYRKYFPWDVNYKKENVPDFFVHKAMAIDINGNDILFTDGYCNRFNEYLSIEICKKSMTNKITKIKIVENKEINIKEYFHQYIKNLEEREIFEKLEKFSKCLKETESLIELENINIELYQFSKINNSLNKLTRTRMKTKELIKKIGMLLKNEEIQNVSQKFDKSIMYWEYINNLFFKYTRNYEKKYLLSVSNSIYKIIDIEKDIYKSLKRIDG